MTMPISAAAAVPTDVYVARQPIVDSGGGLAGYELLFRSTSYRDDASDMEDDMYATSAVITHAFTDIGIDRVVGEVDAFIHVATDFLFSDLVDALPRERTVLELVERCIVDEKTITRCGELRQMGFRIAIKNFVGNFDELDTLLPLVDMVKVDFQRIDPVLVPMIVKMLRGHKARLIAEKVETPEQFAQAKELNIDLFQGFHFARPQLMSAKAANPAKIGLLRLLALAINDAETREIEAEFKHHPTLALSLLRLANSAAMGQRQVITSLRHALVQMGRRQLRVWLQVLLYTANRGGQRAGAAPLLQLAAVRGKLMEGLAERQPGTHGAFKDMAFIAGMLSLMDALLGMSHEQILAELNLAEPVRLALLERKGDIGALLTLVEELERDNRPAIEKSLRDLGGVGQNELVALQLAAYEWANEIAKAA